MFLAPRKPAPPRVKINLAIPACHRNTGSRDVRRIGICLLLLKASDHPNHDGSPAAGILPSLGDGSGHHANPLHHQDSTCHVSWQHITAVLTCKQGTRMIGLSQESVKKPQKMSFALAVALIPLLGDGLVCHANPLHQQHPRFQVPQACHPDTLKRPNKLARVWNDARKCWTCSQSIVQHAGGILL